MTAWPAVNTAAKTRIRKTSWPIDRHARPSGSACWGRSWRRRSAMPRRLHLVEAARAQAGGAELAVHRAVGLGVGAVEGEDVLHLHHLAFHAGDLGDVGHLPLAVGQAHHLDDQADGRGDLLAHGVGAEGQAAHGDHLLQAADGLARVVGVDGGHRAFVAGVHGLQHVEGLLAADLAQDHPVGTHAQGVLDQLALADLALALDVRRPGLHAHHVRLLQLQLGGVLDGDQALARG